MFRTGYPAVDVVDSLPFFSQICEKLPLEIVQLLLFVFMFKTTGSFYIELLCPDYLNLRPFCLWYIHASHMINSYPY